MAFFPRTFVSYPAACDNTEYEQQVLRLRIMEAIMTSWTGTKERYDVDYEKLSPEVKLQLSDRHKIGSGRNGDVHKAVCQKIPMARKSVRACEGRSLKDIKSEIAAILKLKTHHHIIEIVGSYITSYHGEDILHILTFPVAHCDLNVFLTLLQALDHTADDIGNVEMKAFGFPVGTAAGQGSSIDLESLGIFLKKCMGCIAETVA